MDSMNFVSGYSYIYIDFGSDPIFEDANYAFQTRYRTSGDALNQADSVPPTITHVYKPLNVNFDAVILYLVARNIDTELTIDLEYSEETIMLCDLKASEEVNARLETTIIKPFLIDLNDRFAGGNHVWTSVYSFHLVDYPNQYFMYLTFVYSVEATELDDEFEINLIDKLLLSKIEYTT